MKCWINKIAFTLMLSLTVSGVAFAQPSIEIANKPVHIQSSSEVQAVTNQDENPFLANDPSLILPVLSAMLNEGVTDQVAANIEALHRNSAFHPNESLASQLVAFDSVKQSA